MPMRQCHGQLLLHMGRFADADAVFRHDLSLNVHNGWSLYGLLEAVRQQPAVYTRDAVASVEAELAQAWARADSPLQSSCLAF